MIHHVKRCADDAGVFAQQPRTRHRHFRLGQRAQDAIFAFDQMRRRQQLAGRLFTQNEFPGRRLDQVRGIGLPALKLAQLRGQRKILEVLLQVLPQRGFIEPMLRQDVDDDDVGSRRRGGLDCIRPLYARARRRRNCAGPTEASVPLCEIRSEPYPIGCGSRRDCQRTERDAEIDTAARAAQGERHFALGHDLRSGRFHRAGVRLCCDVSAEQLVHAGDRRKSPMAVLDGRLPDGEPAALAGQFHLHRATVAALDGAGPVGGLVERRPALQGEFDRALDVGGGRRGCRVAGTHHGEQQRGAEHCQTMHADSNLKNSTLQILGKHSPGKFLAAARK